MKRTSLEHAIEALARSGDLAAIADHLSDDVELATAITVDVPPPTRRVGKRAVVEHLRGGNVGPSAAPRHGEVLAEDERIVVLRDARLAAPGGLAMDAACAVVLDVRHGAIARIAIHYELQPTLPAMAVTRRDSSRDDDLVPTEADA